MRAREEHQREHARAVGAAVVARVVLEQRDEREQAEVHVAAHRERDQQQRRRAPAVAPAARRRDARVRRGAAQRGEPGELHARRSRGPGSRAARRPPRPNCDAIRPASSGPERDAEVAADREDRHRRRAPLAREPGGELARLGMEAGDADAREQHAQRARPGSVCANASSADADARRRRGRRRAASRPGASRRRCPKIGCTTDEATVAASMIAAVRVYERCSSLRRNGSSAGHAALREIGRHVAAREQPERAERPAQSRCGDGGGAHAANGILGVMPMPPPGVYVPLLTLYDDGEDIDVAATAAFGRRLVDAGVARPRAGRLDGRVPPPHARPSAGRCSRPSSRPARARPCWCRSARPRSATRSRSPSTPRRAARPP